MSAVTPDNVKIFALKKSFAGLISFPFVKCRKLRPMSGSVQTEVCIIGAGPGGATAAIALARKGISSLLVDKAVFPRDKICGDALSGKVVEVFRKLDPSLVDRIAAEPTHLGSWGVTFVAPNTKALRVPFRQNFDKHAEQAPGYIARRLDFDNFLVEECRRYPEIELLEGVGLTEFRREGDRWLLSDKAGQTEISARFVIAADGAHSRFAKTVHGMMMEPKHHCAGLRAYYKGVKGLDHDNFIELHFLKDFLPGYFWIFPLPNGMANVGVGMRTDKVSKRKVNLRERMFEIIEKYPELKDRFQGAELQGKVHGFGLPLGSRKRSISGEGYMLIGDAASLIDPFTGEGIGNALYSGYFAADQVEHCLQTGDLSAKAMQSYDREVYARLWSELKLSHRMQKLVNYPWLFNLVVNKARRNKVLSETISCMFEDLDLRERLRNPMFYVKLLNPFAKQV
jgi:geranylgeranyl reductase family protein